MPPQAFPSQLPSRGRKARCRHTSAVQNTFVQTPYIARRSPSVLAVRQPHVGSGQYPSSPVPGNASPHCMHAFLHRPRCYTLHSRLLGEYHNHYAAIHGRPRTAITRATPSIDWLMHMRRIWPLPPLGPDNAAAITATPATTARHRKAARWISRGEAQ